MLRSVILVTALFGLVSCNYLQDIFEVAIMKTLLSKGMNATKSGQVTDCGKSKHESALSITWDPETVVVGKAVTVQGSITFSEDFVSGKMDVKTSIISQEVDVKCSDMTPKNSCKKGETIQFPPITQTVPAMVPKGTIDIEARLTSDQTHNEILCGKASVKIV